MLCKSTAVLHDGDSGACEFLRGLVIPDPELKPDRCRPLREDILQMRRDIGRPAKHVHHIDFTGDVAKGPVDTASEYFGDIGIIDRHGDDVVAHRCEILGDIECGLLGFLFSLDSEDGDAPHGFEEGSKCSVGVNDVLLPIHVELMGIEPTTS